MTDEKSREALKTSLDALVICYSKSWGGLEQVAAADSCDLAAQGYKVRVLCLEGSPIHENLVHRGQAQPIPTPFTPVNQFDLKLRRELLRLLAEGVNFVHLHQTTLLGSVIPWVWKANLPVFATRHILNNHRKKDPYHRLLYRRLDAMTVISHALRRNVLQTHAIRPDKVHVVNLGLDFELFDPDRASAEAVRRKWGADGDTLVIGTVGRIDPAKGQGTFLKAAAGLMRHLREGEKLRFVIVGEETLGSSGGYLEQLRQMVSQFHMEDRVVFAGYQENIPEVMRSLDLFVMPSRQEAFGLVAIEAMAMETPIVISSGGSADEIVGSEEFGLTVKPDDPYDLQQKLRRLLDSPMERVQMGQRAREHVRKHYDRKVRVEKNLDLYAQALLSRGLLRV